MFARPVSKRAARIARTLPSSPSSARINGGVRLASTGIPTKKPPHRVAGGQNSMLVGSAVLGATLLLGYAFGRGDSVEDAAHKTLCKPSSTSLKSNAGSSDLSCIDDEQLADLDSTANLANMLIYAAKAKADVKAPSVVKKKLEEAKETIIPSSSKSVSSSKSTPPAVSATGATEPAPSIVEDDTVSVTSSVSDPGSLSSSSSEAGEDDDEDPRQAAFNPETGEINWDCPCLGGMAHGVCGEQFREAFSCFVYSKEEPKGQDCIEKFRGMQECFAAHPEVYGEVMGEDEEEEFEVVSASGSSDDGSEYDIVSAVENAIKGDSK